MEIQAIIEVAYILDGGSIWIRYFASNDDSHLLELIQNGKPAWIPFIRRKEGSILFNGRKVNRNKNGSSPYSVQ